MTLDDLQVAILDNLNREELSANEIKWERAILYREARAYFKSDTQFGRWLESWCTGAGTPDSKNTVHKLLSIPDFLDRERFLQLGYAISAELIVKSAWKTYPEEMQELVNNAHNMSQRRVREAVREIQNKPPVSKNVQSRTDSNLAEELELLRTQVSILSGNYQYSEESFFHPNESLKAMQIQQLNKDDDKSVFLLFGLGETFTREELNSAFRRISRQYHPDRGGTVEMFQLVSGLKEVLSGLASN